MKSHYFKILSVLVITALVIALSLLSSSSGVALESVTPTPTQEVLPKHPETLSDIQMLLINASKICQLPCLWGIRPGSTPGMDVNEFLMPTSSLPPDAKNYDVEFSLGMDKDQEPGVALVINVTDKIVVQTEIILGTPTEWLPPETLELQHLLSMMPSTPYAYLSINITTLRLFVTLVYKEGVLAQYAFDLHLQPTSLPEAVFSFCPVLKENSSIQLRLRNGADDIDSLLQYDGIPQAVSLNKTWPVKRMIGIDDATFVQQLIGKTEQCIQLPSYAELTNMGYNF